MAVPRFVYMATVWVTPVYVTVAISEPTVTQVRDARVVLCTTSHIFIPLTALPPLHFHLNLHTTSNFTYLQPCSIITVPSMYVHVWHHPKLPHRVIIRIRHSVIVQSRADLYASPVVPTFTNLIHKFMIDSTYVTNCNVMCMLV